MTSRILKNGLIDLHLQYGWLSILMATNARSWWLSMHLSYTIQLEGVRNNQFEAVWSKPHWKCPVPGHEKGLLRTYQCVTFEAKTHHVGFVVWINLESECSFAVAFTSLVLVRYSLLRLVPTVAGKTLTRVVGFNFLWLGSPGLVTPLVDEIVD